MPFNLKIILAFSVHREYYSEFNSELWIGNTVFLIQLNSKIISAISVQREYCSIQYFEYKMQFFNPIE